MENITTIDFYEGGKAKRTCGYLVEDKNLTIIETGPGPAGEIILQKLKEKGYKPGDLKYIIVSHIHLDHAGAAGYLIKHCPQARLIVHPSGKKHMIDPSRLIAGAKTVFTDFEAIYPPVLAIPEERILTVADGEIFDLGARQLTFYHGRGHAHHHLTIMDNLTSTLFSGDLLGIYYPEFANYDIEYSLLTSAPSQFDPEAFEDSIERIRIIAPEIIAFSHFGARAGHTEHYLDLCLQNLSIYCQVTKEIGQKPEPSWQKVATALKTHVHATLVEMGWPKEKALPDFIDFHTGVNAQGLFHWWQKTHSGTN